MSGAADDLKLPELLKMLDGRTVTSSRDWLSRRRPELLELFRTHMYGRAPVGRPSDLRFEITGEDRAAMSGDATLKSVGISYSGPGGRGAMNLIVFIPNRARKPAPGFVLICNRGPDNIDPTRRKKSDFWPAEEIVRRGYVAAAFLNADIDPDKHDGFKNGVHGIFDAKGSPRPGDAWGAIAAWGWGASRAMDYFERDPAIDAKKIAVIGHSRGGKAALWCGARDDRFALVISNNSGCTGAALARRKRGESVARINRSFPHWFCANYRKFGGREDQLPVDQHMLVALMAPRLVYVASASKDGWADPAGEFLSCVHAAPAYELLGLKGLGTATMPAADTPIHRGHIAYHVRTGKHGLMRYDWKCYMDFADRHWK